MTSQNVGTSKMIIYVINYFQVQLTPRKHIKMFKFYKSSILFKYSGIHILYVMALNIFLFQFEISIHHKWFKRREWISSASRTRPKKQILQNETRNLQDVIYISYFWKKKSNLFSFCDIRILEWYHVLTMLL